MRLDAAIKGNLTKFMKQQGWSNWWWADDIFLTVAWADAAKEAPAEA